MDPPPSTSDTESSLSSAPTNVTAYVSILRDARGRLESYTPTGAEDYTVKVLSAFLECLPKDGVMNIAEDILDSGSSGNDAGLGALAQHLLTAVLVPMKAHPQTPAIPSSRFGADDSIEEISSEIESSSRDQAWLKTACLKRDGNRCILTGAYDGNEWEKLPAKERSNEKTAITEVAHIIPFSMGSFSEPQRWNTATIWDGLYRCFPSIRARLNLSAESINMAANAMTLISPLHQEFGRFTIAFETTHTENVYCLKRYPKYSSYYDSFLPSNPIITLTTHDPRYALPSRILLETHAAIAKILYMTGMAELIDKTLRDRAAIGCLARDGSTNVTSLMLVF